MLKMKNPPGEVKRGDTLAQENHFVKLTQYIQELKIKNNSLSL